MFTIFGIPSAALFGQLLLGLINGSFYAMLSLGLAVIFGLLNIINFAHGAQYMMGAFVAWMLLNYAGIGYWWALLLAPILVGLFGILLDRNFIKPMNDNNTKRSFVMVITSVLAMVVITYLGVNPSLGFAISVGIGVVAATLWDRFGPTFVALGDQHVDHLYGLLLTFGMALIIQGVFRNQYGVSGLPYGIPPQLSGGQNLGFMFLPNYRGWVVAASMFVCLVTWFVIEKTKLGAYLRAATENPTLVQAFGVNVPLLITLTYGFGVGLAALAGVLAAPIYSVNPNMGADLIIVVFAVVVIGGMGSILGSVITGFALGLVEGLTKVFYPEASATVIFVVMVLVLLVKPAGLFGRAQ
ncbi:MAG: branched-chain amino acid transporter permease [Enterovirga sp.]|jgi:branched-chain amino acid transport system permease protein|nr:branched-chain amino acid transporter permease [Enterovirga sp.]